MNILTNTSAHTHTHKFTHTQTVKHCERTNKAMFQKCLFAPVFSLTDKPLF